MISFNIYQHSKSLMKKHFSTSSRFLQSLLSWVHLLQPVKQNKVFSSYDFSSASHITAFVFKSVIRTNSMSVCFHLSNLSSRAGDYSFHCSCFSVTFYSHCWLETWSFYVVRVSVIKSQQHMRAKFSSEPHHAAHYHSFL